MIRGFTPMKKYPVPGALMERRKLVEIASRLGVSDKFYTATIKSLVWKIQAAQGRTQCYLSDDRYDCKRDCEWSHGCKGLTSVWLR
jgi:hypothetical protein